MTLLAAVMWWFLAQDTRTSLVSSIGPFSAEEMCRLAGERMTDNPWFWTPKRKEDERVEREKRNKAQSAAIEKARKSPGTWAESGYGRFVASKNGSVVQEGGGFVESHRYQAITQCLPTK